MTSKIFKEHKDKIREYCVNNNLSFDKVCSFPWSYDNEELIVLWDSHNPEREKLGLMDDILMPSVLEIYLENGKLRFVQTDITRKYLGVQEEYSFVTMPKAAVA